MSFEGLIDKSYLTEHPEGKIRLLSGKLIDGYPKGNAYETHRHGIGYQYDAPESTFDLFVENAFWLYMHRWLILQDSRMFLTPLYVENHLAFIGHGGFSLPILGTYIEWWMNCECSRVYKPHGRYNLIPSKDFSLICKMVGSALSGSNSCITVDKDGKRDKASLISFKSAYIPFVSINIRYNPCKDVYEAYSLERVIDILKGYDEKFGLTIKQK